MRIKTQGTVWTVLLSAAMLIGQWLDDTYFHTGIREWLPKFLNSAQMILGLGAAAVGLAYTIYMETLAKQAHNFGPDHLPDTRSVNWTREPEKSLLRRIL